MVLSSFWIDICNAGIKTEDADLGGQKTLKCVFFEKRTKKNASMLADNKINLIFADLLRD